MRVHEYNPCVRVYAKSLCIPRDCVSVCTRTPEFRVCEYAYTGTRARESQHVGVQRTNPWWGWWSVGECVAAAAITSH